MGHGHGNGTIDGKWDEMGGKKGEHGWELGRRQDQDIDIGTGRYDSNMLLCFFSSKSELNFHSVYKFIFQKVHFKLFLVSESLKFKNKRSLFLDLFDLTKASLNHPSPRVSKRTRRWQG